MKLLAISIVKNPLFYVFVVPMLADAILTLWGQPATYWVQNNMANEASPVFLLLKVSPYLVIIGNIVWFRLVYLLIRALKEPLNLFLTFAFLLCNSWGSSQWILKLLREQTFYNPGDRNSITLVWAIIVCYFLLIAAISTYSFHIYTLSKKYYLCRNISKS